MFGGRIGAVKRKAALRFDGTDVYESAASGSLQLRQSSHGAKRLTDQVDFNDLSKLLLVCLLKHSIDGYGRGMYPDVNPAIALDGIICQCLHLLVVAYICCVRGRLTAPGLNFIDQLGKSRQRAPGNYYLRPSFCKPQRRLPSDAAVGSNDHNDLFLDWF